MSELHSKQSAFVYSACGQFTEHRERIRKFEETGDSKKLYKEINYVKLGLLMILFIMIVKI